MEKINKDYKSKFDELFKKAEVAWSEANSLKIERGEKLPGEEGAFSIDQWKNSIRNQKWAIDLAALKLEEARRVYDFYERQKPTKGLESYFWWKNYRKTYYSVDIENIINEQQCIRELTDLNGKKVSIHLAAKEFDKNVKLRTQDMINRVDELRKMSAHLEENEIKRLNPGRYNHCIEVTKQYADTEITSEFCGTINSVGYQKLMPFAGCISNLESWGYKNIQHKKENFERTRELHVSEFFETCRMPNNIQSMLRDDRWSTCMKKVVHNFSYSSDAARFCSSTENKFALETTIEFCENTI